MRLCGQVLISSLVQVISVKHTYLRFDKQRLPWSTQLTSQLLSQVMENQLVCLYLSQKAIDQQETTETCAVWTPLSDTGRKRLQEVTCVCWEFISLVTRQNMFVPKVLCNHFISCSIYIYWTHFASAHYCRSQAFKMNKESLFPFRRRGINTWSTRYST